MKFCASLHSDQVDSGDEFVSGAGIAASARAAEAAGFDAVYVTEHPIPNDSWLAEEGHHALDPFVTLAVAAAATSSLRVLTYLCVVPYHNPFVLAKTALTVDVLSGGRFVFGGGAGYLQPEFAAVGASFDDRNDRFDAAITTMKEVWSRDSVPISASGVTHTMRPRPVHQPHPPLWLGGNSRRALRRAVELGDGWIPFLHPPGLEARHRTPELWTVKQLAFRFDELHELEATTGRKLQDVLFSPVEEVGYYGTSAFDPDAFRQVVQEYESLGVTMTLVYIPAGTRDEYCDLLASFGAEMIGSVNKG
jgi:probable F420-dependent oxidoreductase